MVTRRKAKSDKLMALVHELELEYGSIVNVPYADRRLIQMQKLAEDDEVKKNCQKKFNYGYNIENIEKCKR